MTAPAAVAALVAEYCAESLGPTIASRQQKTPGHSTRDLGFSPSPLSDSNR